MPVVVISHSDVKNADSSICFLFGLENIYLNQEENLVKEMFVCEYMPTSCEKALIFKYVVPCVVSVQMN